LIRREPPPPEAPPPAISEEEKEERSAKRRRGSVAKLASATYVSVALGVITGPIVARALGPTARGEYAAIFIYATVLVTVLAFGLPQALTHSLVNKEESRERLMGAALRFAALLVLPAVLLGVGAGLLVLDTLSGAELVLGIVAIAMAPLGVFGVCLLSFLTAESALGALTWLRAGPLIGNFVGIVVLVAAGQLTLVNYLILTIGVSLLVTFASWKFVEVRPRGHAKLSGLLRFGMRAYPGAFARMLNVRLDQLILVPLLAPAQVGFYAIAITISSLPTMLAEALGTRAIGNVIQDGLLLSHRAERYLRLALIISVVGSLGLTAISPLAVPLFYGDDFDGVVAPLLLLLLGAVANSGSLVAAPCLLGVGRPGVNSMAELSSLVITGFGLWYALPRYGIAGAAAVSSAAYLYRFSVQLYVLRGYNVRRLRPRRADVAEIIQSIPVLRSIGSKHAA
jgi:O-antigen/teichoic acid export membrane protein